MEDPPDNEAEAKATKPILLGGEDAMEEDENAPLPTPTPMDLDSSTSTSGELLSRIVTPSPYVHHTTGATAARFRNAMTRIATDPLSDVEAWQAIITEANTCFRTLMPQLHSVDAETHAKLDWIESCFGALLQNFPYAHVYYVSIVEMLLAQTARVGEEDGPLTDYGRDPSRRVLLCERKIEAIFRKVLGVKMDGTPVQEYKLGGMCSFSVELWLLYVRKRIRDANRELATTPEEKAELVRKWSTEAYELAIQHCSFGNNNHLIWKQYLAFVKSWILSQAINVDHALAQKQMIQLRSVYQRLASRPMTGLDQLWQEYEAFERTQNEALAAALIAEHLPKYQHARGVYLERNRVYNVTDLQMGRLATPPANTGDEDYANKIQEEMQLLALWRKRSSYERTNPERLTGADFVQRVRHAYKEMACALTRHPEVWHMWAMWELHRTGVSDDSKGDCSIEVLKLGQTCIPDCTLLSYSESQVVELHTDKPSACISVLERFVERSPNSLGFVLYQQLVRRYHGVQSAREVFARARRVLSESDEKTDKAEKTVAAVGEATKETVQGNEANASADTENVTNDGIRRMVTNRLGADIGTNASQPLTDPKPSSGETIDAEEGGTKARPGVITWQLYASHASMEHRLNHTPSVAARVYELGLRKHSSFLTKPPYVLRYAQLLLELGDNENLRALLSRAVAACQAQEGATAEVATLWDMSLRFEAIASGRDPTDVSALDGVERKRRAALFGDDVEDVSTGSMKASGDLNVNLVGSKSSISEQLIRSEGYDVSSRIVNGLSRTVEVLEIMGVLGNGETTRTRRRITRPSINDDTDSMVGGVSDASYQQRLQYQAMAEAGLSIEAAVLVGDGAKTISARERLQQIPSGQAGPTSAAAIMIQQSPEWLRSLLVLLPASQLRTATMGKPPPHMIEMALSSLRSNALPAERPADNGKSGAGEKRKRENAGDSSDDEDGNGGGGGGYGSQFRSRQRARQMGDINGADGTVPHQ